MKREADIVSEVWRESCRHVDLGSAVAAVATLLQAHLPVRSLAVLLMGPASRTLEPVAVGGADRLLPPPSLMVAADAATWERFEVWLRLGHATPIVSEPWLRELLPDGGSGQGIAVPLRSPAGAIGVVVVDLEPSLPAPGDPIIARLLGAPLAEAVDNDARLVRFRSFGGPVEGEGPASPPPASDGDVVGAHGGLRVVMARVMLVASSDVPVLILGETGTGKEIISRAIHARSPRADGPFVRVNCGAIPSELIDSQLFGHEKGSFTGAFGQHQGWFERASGGTLFLDEIGELPLPAQVRLLRVLQDHQIERVGGRSPIDVDVRIVAATHQDLSAMVRARTFREDLWYRVNGFPVVLPPLRDRLEDIPALTRHFARIAASRFGLPGVEPGEREFRILAGHHWPGNVREFGAVIDRAAILGGGRTLDVAAAIDLGRQSEPAPAASDVTLYEVIPESPPQVPSRTADTGEIVSLAEAMRRHIERALAATNGRIEGTRGAAAILDINPHTLRARMRKLGIDANGFRP